jgi:hypothetical protein
VRRFGTKTLCVFAAALGLAAAAACGADQGGEGGDRTTSKPTEERSDAKTLAHALVPSSMERPSEEDAQLEECPLAAGETVSCVEFNVWTTAVSIGKRRRLF